jgi:thiamine-phosphate diphosphorylase / hydroxyethylthiazole kinase
MRVSSPGQETSLNVDIDLSGEIMAVTGASNIRQHGVDSGTSTSTPSQKAEIVKSLAQRERCVVLMTGAVDFLSDGTRTFAISNGSHFLGIMTGTGCALGSVIASYVAVHREDKLLAALAALLHYEIAAERAAERLDVKGPGSFSVAFLDELYILGKTLVEGGDVYIEKRAKVESF